MTQPDALKKNEPLKWSTATCPRYGAGTERQTYVRAG
jgi:hypothetical protein